MTDYCKLCCGEVVIESEEVDCFACNATGRGDHGSRCDSCNGLGVRMLDTWHCNCDADACEDDDAP